MNQDSKGHGSLKEMPKLAVKSFEAVKSKDIKVPPPPPGDQSILRLCRQTSGRQPFADNLDRYQLPSGAWMLAV